MNYILRAGNVRAAVLSSARYPGQLADLASRLAAPILMLHGTADSPADGGTEHTDIQMARDFEGALRAAGKLVEAVYCEGGRHNDIVSNSTRYRDEVERMLTFLRRHLRG